MKIKQLMAVGLSAFAAAAMFQTAYADDTLQSKINAAESGATIILTENVTEDIVIPAGKEITLDLKGFKLTNVSGDTITNNGTLTVTGNGTVDNLTNGKAAVKNNVGAAATLENGTYDRSLQARGNSYYTIMNQGSMTLNDVTVNNNGHESSCVENGWYTRSDNTTGATAVMTINGGTYTGGINTIKNDDYGKITINAGDFSKAYQCSLMNAGEADINGGTYTKGTGKWSARGAVWQDNTDENDPILRVNGGTFADKIDYNGKYAYVTKIVITGGTFLTTPGNIIQKSLADGYLWTGNENGKYTAAKDDGNYSVMSGSLWYKTIEDVMKVGNSKTIKLMTNVSDDLVIEAGKSYTIDLNGYTLTNVSDNTVVNYGTVTIKDSSTAKSGVVDNVTHQKAAVVNYGKAYLRDVKFIRSAEAENTPDNSGGNSFYVIQNFNTMTLYNGVTVESTGHFSSLIENGWYDGNKNTDKTAATLTIKDGTFTGGINTIKNDDWGVLIISGGTFTNQTQYAVLNWNEATVSGGTFDGAKASITNGYINDTMDKGTLNISGGTFNNTIDTNEAGAVTTITGGTFADIKSATGTKTEISGGTFAADVNKYAKDGYEAVLGDDGRYTVQKAATAEVKKLELSDGVLKENDFDTTLGSRGDQITVSNVSEKKGVTAVYTFTKDGKTVDKTFSVDFENMTIGGEAYFGILIYNIPEGVTVAEPVVSFN